MSFTMVTSLNTYTKNMKMQMRWEQRRSNGDYTRDNHSSFARQIQQEAGGISGGFGVNAIGESTGGSSDASIMSGIRAKLNAGKRLSSSELEYLKKNDPETYQHVKAMEAERKAYEQRLRRCKTKEEVQRLKASQMASSLDRVRDVNNNPNIPDGEKLKLTLQEHQKVSSVTDATTKFAESGEYRKLPTEAEKRKAEKDLKEAREAEMRGETKDDKDKVTDEKASRTEEDSAAKADPAKASPKAGEETAAKTDTINTAPETEAAAYQDKAREAGSAQAASRTARAAEVTTISGNTYRRNVRPHTQARPADAQIAKAKEIRLASRKTRVEAELTPEAQKVRRSRARSTYVQNMQSNEVVISVDIRR